MIIFNHADSDVLGTVTIGQERYQLRKSDSAEPDVYHWQNTRAGRKTWVKVGGYHHTNKLAMVRAEWYRAGGANEKAKL